MSKILQHWMRRRSHHPLTPSPSLQSLLSQWQQRSSNPIYPKDYRLCLSECLHDLRQILHTI